MTTRIAADQGKVTALVLHLSSIDHDTMIQVLKDRFQVEGQALAWFILYLNDR